MNKTVYGGVWLALSLLAYGTTAACRAQDFGSLLHVVADKATGKIADKATAAATGTQPASGRDSATPGNHSMPAIIGGSDFSAAPLTLYQDDFDSTAIGSLPKPWRTNGSGQVVNIQGFAGKWLALNAGSTFKLAPTANLPQRYTVEFDLIAAGDEPGDVGTAYVGFASNNSVTDYLQGGAGNGALNALAIQFGNSTHVSALSGATGHSATADFPVDDYLNRVLHVSISVNGDQEQIWLDGSKVLDSRMFDRNASRYFFFSAPWQYDHHAQAMIGHVRIATYP